MKRRDLFKVTAAAAALPLVSSRSARVLMDELPAGTVVRGLWIGDYNREAFRAACTALVSTAPHLLLLDFEECGLGASELLASARAVARDSHSHHVHFRSAEERSPHWMDRKLDDSGALVLDGVELDAGRWPDLAVFLQRESKRRPVVIAGCDSSGWLQHLRKQVSDHEYVWVRRPCVPELVELLRYCLDPSGTRLDTETLMRVAAGSRPFHAIYAKASRAVGFNGV